MDACKSPEKSNEMSSYEKLKCYDKLPMSFTITSPLDIERRPINDVGFNTLDTSATKKSARRKLKFVESPGKAPKRKDSPKTTRARITSKNVGSDFHLFQQFSNSLNDIYYDELRELDVIEKRYNILPLNFDSVIHGQMTHPPLRRGVSLNDRVSSYSRRIQQSPTNDGLDGLHLGEISPLFKILRFQSSEREIYSSINNKRWTSVTQVKATVEQAKPVPRKSISMIDSSLNIMKAIEKADMGWIGDHSKPFCLPITNGKRSDLTFISVHTMAKLLNREYKNVVNSFRVIDCRFPYEFEMGHIKGAENLYKKEDVYNSLISPKIKITNTEDGLKRNIIIFHCEFSSRRGPALSKFLRTKDRDVNKEIYPALHYPEIYLLDGGYNEFFKYYTEHCDPKAYQPMKSVKV